ncbi:MAG: LamG domain-containing protein [Kofleriaceae bacterium]
MRAAIGLIALAACGFTPAPAVTDARPDGEVPPIDTPVGRTRDGLIAFWTFDEASGATIDDTNGNRPPIRLDLSDAVTWTGGRMLVDRPVLGSSPNGSATRLTTECLSTRGVTLEAWIEPLLVIQGSNGAPAVIAGVNATINSRNISILHAGDRWLGRVRTSQTAPQSQNGAPDLLPPAGQQVANGMNHVVVVADASSRALYVNGERLAETAPEGPTAWEGAYRMVLGNELAMNRSWLGTYALVAIYNRGLTEDEIRANFQAGPDATK